MMSRVYCACPIGVHAAPVVVETDVRDNLLKIGIVGLPDAATRESKERLIPAISNSGYSLANEEIIINLSPADLRKEGALYDLPMAIGILAAKGVIPKEQTENAMFMGELALDGALRPVRSALALAECARDEGFGRLYLPKGNGLEASLVSSLEIYEAESLAALVHFLRGKRPLTAFSRGDLETMLRGRQEAPDFADVKGQAVVKRALEIAAAGGHNALLFGPPGSGKSMLSKRLPGIMPPMSREEVIETTRIHGAIGALTPDRPVILRRPFRAPHHTASPVAMIGGGAFPKPGEATRAHRGVLFLDEFPEFPRSVLETLRQPLEDRWVTISRANQQIRFPADFLLVAAMNPCPCGWRGARRRGCSCTDAQVQQYRARLSGPLLDRIDLHVETPAIAMSLIRKLPPGESSATIAERVAAARERQRRRFQSTLTLNASMSPSQLRAFCPVPDALAERLEQALEARGASIRAHDKVLRTARTIADLAGRADLNENDLNEALGYRQLDFGRGVLRARAPEEVPS